MKMKTTQNLWGTLKAMLKGRFIAIQAYLKKQEKGQVNNRTLPIKQLEKEEMKNRRVSRRKEILKIRAEINAKTKGTTAKINKAKSWFFERRNKMDKPLARLIKKQREKNQINKIRNENRDHNRQHRNTKDHKRLLSAIICQENGQLGRTGQILRKVQLSKTEPGRNRKS